MAQPHRNTFDLRTAFANDPQRFERLSLDAGLVRADLSKQLWDPSIVQALLSLADGVDLAQRRHLLLSGGVVNPTEGRSAAHAAWRLAAEHSVPTALDDFLQLAESIRHTPRITDVVHIGIGGSALGPELALQALQPFATGGPRIHIVSNLDGHDLHQTLQGLHPHHTLFLVVSKSWSTPETLHNTRSAQAWLAAHAVPNPSEHFVAVTAQAERARASGLGRCLDIPLGIGGRFSVWSAVGLPLAIALGRDGFLSFLRGGAVMDRHFEHTPWPHNLPVMLGLLDVWNSTFMGFASRCVVPYAHGLRRLPAYLQQLEMESNGKRVDLHGAPLPHTTTGLTWGEVGSNSQHAFFQWLHQGTCPTPVEFVLVAQARHDLADHHRALLANALAQSQALMVGRSAGHAPMPGHQDFPGNRPSTTLLLDELNPRSLGALLALYEHRAFVAGAVWGINSFDQWGVELGKTLAQDLEQRLRHADVQGLDASTAGLIGWLG